MLKKLFSLFPTFKQKPAKPVLSYTELCALNKGDLITALRSVRGRTNLSMKDAFDLCREAQRPATQSM